MKQTQARKERLAAALRENLKRRKARARALAQQGEKHAGEAAEEPRLSPETATNRRQDK
ncbi:MAG: hypothetical protein ACT4OG_04470 [Alphaproteobacteria bacterium]